MADEQQNAIPLSDFLFGNELERSLSAYGRSFGKCDPRAAASFWSLYYFATLAIPFIIAARQKYQLPIALEQMNITFNDSGLPKRFGITQSATCLSTTEPLDWISVLVSEHLSVFVQRLSEVAGISRKLSWNNAAVYINYALKLTAPEGEHLQSPTHGSTVFDVPCLPNGAGNPMFGCLRYESENGEVYCRRKLCCLRYLLPGIKSCGELCAKPELRKTC